MKRISLQDVYAALAVAEAIVAAEAQRVGIAAHKPESHREAWAVDAENPDFTLGTTVTFDVGPFAALSRQASAYLMNGIDPNDQETLRDISDLIGAVCKFAEEQTSRQVVDGALATFAWNWCLKALRKVAGQDLVRALAASPTNPRIAGSDIRELRQLRERRAKWNTGDDGPQRWN